MKKILTVLLLLVLIAPVMASDEDNFRNWVDNYYESDKVSNDDLQDLFDEYSAAGAMDRDDFGQLDRVYKNVYSYGDSKITQIMDDDFNNADKNNDGELSFKEFKKLFKKIYSYSKNSPSDYEFFLESDTNHDGLIDFGEFSSISYIFTEDSFWDGYSIDEILQSEWSRASENGDDYLNFTEFKNVI